MDQPVAHDGVRVQIDGVSVDAMRRDDVATFITERAAAGEGGLVVTVNVDHLKQLASGGPLTAAYENASLVLPDGQPIVWAARIQGEPLPERVAGSDLLWALSGAAAVAGAPVGLIGGGEGSAEATASELRERYPDLSVPVAAGPHVSDEPTDADVDAVASLVDPHPCSIVFLAFGSPKQEILALRLRHRLPDKWFLGVGAAFDMACGNVRRAPQILQRAGLEWAWRLALEPRRLARRYLVDDATHVPRLIRAAAAARAQRRSPASTPVRQRSVDLDLTTAPTDQVPVDAPSGTSRRPC